MSCDFSDRPYVLFDFDGTLADTRQGIIETARITLTEWGMTEEEMGDLNRLIGPPFPQAYSDIYGMSTEDAAEVCRRYRARYATLGPETHPLYPGVGDLLHDLVASGRTIAVASSKKRDFVVSMLGDTGVLDLFAQISAQTDEAHSSKAELVQHALTLLGATADQAVMVGDRFYDVEGALACGMPCVGVAYGGTPREELEQAGAACIADSAEDLRAALIGPQTM